MKTIIHALGFILISVSCSTQKTALNFQNFNGENASNSFDMKHIMPGLPAEKPWNFYVVNLQPHPNGTDFQIYNGKQKLNIDLNPLMDQGDQLLIKFDNREQQIVDSKGFILIYENRKNETLKVQLPTPVVLAPEIRP